MARNAVQLAADYAAKFTAPGNFYAAEFFRCHTEYLVGEHCGEIVRPVSVRDVAVPRDLLADFFNRAVQITDIRDRLVDYLAVGFDYEAQHPMRARMLCTHTDRHFLGNEAGLCLTCFVRRYLPEHLLDLEMLLSA